MDIVDIVDKILSQEKRCVFCIVLNISPKISYYLYLVCH